MSSPVEIQSPDYEQMARTISDAQAKQIQKDLPHPIDPRMAKIAEIMEKTERTQALREEKSHTFNQPDDAADPIAARAAQAREKSDPAFAAAASAPAEHDRGVLATIDFIETTPHLERQADSRVQTDNRLEITLFSAAAIVILLLSIYAVRNANLRTTGAWIMQTIRQRAALVICLGAALIAADWLVFSDFDLDRHWGHLHSKGWISLFGAFAALVGIYHWISAPLDTKK